MQVYRRCEGLSNDSGHAGGEGEHLCAFLGAKTGQSGHVAAGDDEAMTVRDRMKVQYGEGERALGDDVGGRLHRGDFAEGTENLHPSTLIAHMRPGERDGDERMVN